MPYSTKTVGFPGKNVNANSSMQTKNFMKNNQKQEKYIFINDDPKYNIL